METEAAGILSSWVGQLGIFGLLLAVLGLFMWLWLRESRAVRADTETVIARKDRELASKEARIAVLESEVEKLRSGRDERVAELEDDLAESRAQERKTYLALMECRFPKDGVG